MSYLIGILVRLMFNNKLNESVTGLEGNLHTAKTSSVYIFLTSSGGAVVLAFTKLNK